MFRDIRKLLTLKKRRLRDKYRWWGDMKISDPRAKKAEIILDNFEKQKEILTQMDSLLSQLNKLERSSEVVRINAMLKYEDKS